MKKSFLLRFCSTLLPCFYYASDAADVAADAAADAADAAADAADAAADAADAADAAADAASENVHLPCAPVPYMAVRVLCWDNFSFPLLLRWLCARSTLSPLLLRLSPPVLSVFSSAPPKPPPRSFLYSLLLRLSLSLSLSLSPNLSQSQSQ